MSSSIVADVLDSRFQMGWINFFWMWAKLKRSFNTYLTIHDFAGNLALLYLLSFDNYQQNDLAI